MSCERLNRRHRHITKRIIVRGTLILDTPTCLGSGDANGDTDLTLLRDSIEKRALLTGSSIAGALRNYLREYQGGYDAKENSLLFGGNRINDDGEQSPVIVNDSLSNQLQAELRDGVKINSVTRTAEKGAKYDLELLTAGTKFDLCFELLIDQQDNNEDELVRELAIALQGLERGEISIGMKKRRGFGRCHVEKWQVWQFDLTKEDQRLKWLTFEHWSRGLLLNYELYSSVVDAFKAANIEVHLSSENQDKRDRFLIHATFKLASPLLIRSGQASGDRAPDVVHLKSCRDGELKPVLSGTSLAGVLRHRGERIVNTLEKDPKLKLINEIFGFVEDKKTQVELTSNNGEKKAKASRLIVHESVINSTTDLVQNRIAIDRFTGGAYHGALFNEQPIFGSNETSLKLELELRQPKDHEIGLLLLLLKDLWTGDLPVGGTSSIGRGRLQGISAEMIYHQPGEPEQRWTIFQEQPDQPLQVIGAEELQKFVSALRSYSTSSSHEETAA